MIKPYVISGIAALMILMATGCYYDNEEELYPSSQELPTVVTYSEHIQPITNQSCAIPSCHVTGTGLPVLDNYEGVKAVGTSGRLENRVVNQMSMPPSGPLGSYERQLIDKWINTGFNP